MAIDLPAALPPEQLVMHVPADAATVELDFRGFRLHLHGSAPASADELERLIEPAEDLSAAVRLLADLYVEAGYPAARLHYFLVDEDLHLLVRRGHLTDIDAPQRLRPYFDDLVGASPLRDRDLEPRRVLASLHADRIGQDYTAEFAPDGLDGRTLQLRAVDDDADPPWLSVGVGNSGNRFTGRYLMDVLVEQSLETGDRFRFGWQTALDGLNDSQRSDRFDDYAAGWSRVHPAGVFGLQAQLKRYAFTVSTPSSAGERASARILELVADWQYPLWAAADHRVIASSQLDYTSKRARLADGTTLQDEAYPSVQAGLEGSWLTSWPAPQQLTLTVGVDLRHGLGRDDDSVDERYVIGRPRLTAALILEDRWELLFHGEAQITRDTVPEQSQWVLGGVDALAAWLPGIAVGDSGSLARLQLSHLETPAPFDIELIPGVFVEYGRARFEPPDPVGRTAELADIGTFLDARHPLGIRARASVARGIADSGIDRDALARAQATFHFSIAVSF